MHFSYKSMNELSFVHNHYILDVYHTTFDPPSNHDILKRLIPDPESSEDVMIERLLQYHR